MKKGISLVILVITIIILIILASVIIINTNYMFVDTNLSKLQVDISQIETLMNTYKIRNNGNIDFPTVEFDVSSLSSEELKQFDGEIIENNKVELYIVNIEEIDGEASNFGTLELGDKDRYLYSLTTGKVYYEQGLVSEDTTYYYIKNGEV